MRKFTLAAATRDRAGTRMVRLPRAGRPGRHAALRLLQLGKPGSQETRADTTRPGASEIRHYPPMACTGSKKKGGGG
jgi:hypothetical protein